MTKESFGNWFREASKAAGVPGSAHGLRKAGATRAAENGATTTELKAMFGWTDDAMPAHYTRTADRARTAASGMSKLEKRGQTLNSYPLTLSPHPAKIVGKTEGKDG
jgi:integrase